MSTHVANATAAGQGGGGGWLDIEWRGLGGQQACDTHGSYFIIMDIF